MDNGPTQTQEMVAANMAEKQPAQLQMSYSVLLEWQQNELVHSWKSHVTRCMSFSQKSKRKWRRRTNHK